MVSRTFCIILTVLLLEACDTAVNLVDSIDGPEGTALTISPVSGSVVIDSSLTFTASGGVAPYVFSLSAGSTGAIDGSTGVYTAPSSVGSDTVIVEDSFGAKANAQLEIISPPDYAINLNSTLTPASHVAGNGFSGNFTVQNTSGTGGSETVFWAVYISSDTVLTPGTDPLASTGNLSALAGNSTSALQNFNGNWLSSGAFYLIVSLTAGDDSTTGNNTAVSSTSYTVADPDVDYRISSFPAGGGTYTAGTAIPAGENFTISNDGADNGNSDIFWIVYFSTDATLDSDSDPILDLNTVGPLNGGGASTIYFTRDWPLQSGTYYMFITFSAVDDITPGNNLAAPSSAYTINP